MKGHPIRWTPDELAWIKARATQDRAETHAAFVAVFGRPEVKLTALNQLCKRRGWLTGRTGRFPPGKVPPNKGRKGICAPGSEKGWFPKGTRQGRAAALHKPIGTERVSRDGYLERKVHDGLPMQSRWRAVHLIRWEAANGTVPKGHCLKCLDGDRLNTDPDNWLPVPRALLPRLAGRWSRSYDTAPAELRPTLLAIARLEHAARERAGRKK